MAETSPAVGEPAAAPEAAAPSGPEKLALALRGAFVVCGGALLVGFFLPWVKLGPLLTVSGLGLSLADGEMVGMISGSGRFLLFAIPGFGALLLAGGILGHRSTTWVAVAGAVAILGYGFYTVLELFFSSTGFGMWLVVLAALLSLGFGLVGLGRKAA